MYHSSNGSSSNENPPLLIKFYSKTTFFQIALSDAWNGTRLTIRRVQLVYKTEPNLSKIAL